MKPTIRPVPLLLALLGSLGATATLSGCDPSSKVEAEDRKKKAKKKKKKKKGSDDDGGATVPAEPKLPAPPAFSECGPAPAHPGAWRPTAAFVSQAMLAVSGRACSTLPQAAAAVEACGRQAGTTTPKVEVASPGNSACTFSIQTITSGARRFLMVDVFVGVEGRFHGELYVFEDEKGRPVPYHADFVGSLALCSGRADTRAEAARVRADWSGFSPAVRTFMCGQKPGSSPPPPPPPSGAGAAQPACEGEEIPCTLNDGRIGWCKAGRCKDICPPGQSYSHLDAGCHLPCRPGCDSCMEGLCFEG